MEKKIMDNKELQISVRDKAWSQYYNLLKEYIVANGRFPSQGVVFKGANIGRWLDRQKKSKRAGKMLPEREALLRAIGTDFEPTQDAIFESQWQQGFALLREYTSTEGCLPPQRTVYKGANLGTWLHTQKLTYKNGRLPEERAELLRSTGVALDGASHCETWQRNFAFFKEYTALEGRLPTSDSVYKGIHLGRWLSAQRVAFKKGKLLPDREALMRAAGVEFEVSEHDKAWRKNYSFLREYVACERRLPPRRAVFKGVSLGYWLREQKKYYKAGKLRPERAALLRSAGVELVPGETEEGKKKWRICNMRRGADEVLDF